MFPIVKVYLDNAATTRPDPRVLEVMSRYAEEFYNPSASYTAAVQVRSSLREAAVNCASLIGAKPEEIVFTSGGTESDNAAIMGAYEYHMAHGGGSFHMITDETEHPAVLNTCRRLQRLGAEVTYVSPDDRGFIPLQAVKAAIRPDTRFISVMTANNETGAVQDAAAIGELARKQGILFHTDAVQAYGNIPMDVNAMHVDLLSASAHKIHGPKGIGLLYVRSDSDIMPFITGGGQQNGMRSGTEYTAGIAGFGEAARLVTETGAADRIRELRDRLARRICEEIPDVILNGPELVNNRLPGNLNVSFGGVEGSSLLINLDIRGVCCSTGSACSASSDKPSHVLKAMGLTDERIRGSIRFSLSRYTTRDEIEYTVNVLKTELAALRMLRFD